MKSSSSDTASSSSLVFVDMDGTLYRTDTLWEQIAIIVRTPLLILPLLISLIKGRLAFKKLCFQYAGLPDLSLLPVNPSVIEYIKEAKNNGAKVVLATAALEQIAEETLKIYPIFDDYIASTELLNNKGKVKSERIKAYAQGVPYSYIGDSRADIAVWDDIGSAISVNNSSAFTQLLIKKYHSTTILEKPNQPSFALVLMREMRMYQWIKNILIFIPMLLAHSFELQNIVQSFITFILFGLTASSVYIFNDILDVSSDRIHSRKSTRPIASGELSIYRGFISAIILLFTAIVLSIFFLNSMISIILLIYFITTSAYTVLFKRIAIIDVLILAGLYTLRLVAGGISGNVPISPWLLGFSMFLFLSLAFVKRYAEVIATIGKDLILKGRGYTVNDSILLLSSGICSAMLSILVLALYINSEAVTRLYIRPEYLWIICPVFLLWLLRLWLSAHRGNMHDDPIIAMARDSFSYVGLFIILCAVIMASIQ